MLIIFFLYYRLFIVDRSSFISIMKSTSVLWHQFQLKNLILRFIVYNIDTDLHGKSCILMLIHINPSISNFGLHMLKFNFNSHLEIMGQFFKWCVLFKSIFFFCFYLVNIGKDCVLTKNIVWKTGPKF